MAERKGKTVPLQRRGHAGVGHGGFRAGRPCRGIELQPVEGAEVDHHVGLRRDSAELVPATPRRDGQALIGREPHRLGHVFGAGRADDDLRPAGRLAAIHRQGRRSQPEVQVQGR